MRINHSVMQTNKQTVIVKYSVQNILKNTDKKGKKLVLEFKDETLEFEGEKIEIQALQTKLEDVKLRVCLIGGLLQGLKS